MSESILAPISIFLALITLGALNCNWQNLLSPILKTKWHSPVPFMGQITGVLALLLYPHADLTAYWWVPIILDIKSIILIPELIKLYIEYKQSTSETEQKQTKKKDQSHE